MSQFASISLRFFFILSSYQYVDLLSGLFPGGFPSYISYVHINFVICFKIPHMFHLS